MTKGLYEMSYTELANLISKAIEEINHKAYNKGYEKGRLDQRMESDLGKVVRVFSKLTSQQGKRDRIVERAKNDVEKLTFERPLVKVKGLRGCPDTMINNYDIEFVVDKKKRTIVALLRGMSSNKVRSRGIAKCAPSDCFNVHIGKAIALRRALGLEVPDEYLNAPQPTEVRVGDVVVVKKDGPYICEPFVVQRINEDYLYDKPSEGWIRKKYATIIDDSREEVSE